MNGNVYLLDTNFVINLQKRKPDELQFLLDNQVKFSDCFISVITKLEVLGFHGQTDNEKANMQKLIDNFHCFELDLAIQQKTIAIREQRKLKLPDSIFWQRLWLKINAWLWLILN